LPAGAPERGKVLGALAATALIVKGDFPMARAVASEAAEASRRVGDTRRVADALITLGSAEAYIDGLRDAGCAHLQEALDLAMETGHHDTALRAYINLAEALRVLGRLGEAAEMARRGAAFAERIGSKITGIIVTGNLAEVLVQRGDWDEAEAVLSEALTYAPAGVPGRFLHQIGAELALGRGDLEAARQRRVHMGDDGDAQFVVKDVALVTLLALAEGRLDDARRDLAASLETLDLASPYVWPLVWLAMRVEADIAEEARGRRVPPDDQHADRLEVVAASIAALGDDLPALRGYTALAGAERLRATGERSVEAWSVAVEEWRAAGELPRLAYALFRLAQAHVASGDRAAASPFLSEAFVIAERLRAAPLLDDIRSLGARARVEIGVVDDEAREPDEFGLTPREVEVLRLVADGLGNGDIGGRLFISPKTVSVHVSNIIAKLGVTNRGEAAALAHRRGLFAG
jgi:ATP/maltotriose-dependent transcriptional regulator MalT